MAHPDMRIDPNEPTCTEYPQFRRLSHRIVYAFESEVDEALDGMIEDDTLDALEGAAIGLRGRVEASIDDAFHWGAAVAFGLMGMAEAIRSIPNIEACPACLKWKSGWVIGTGYGPNEWLPSGKRMCTDCFYAEKTRRTHPYR